jgi:phosphatidylglycerol:prolipoprotein diacylglycerol transferase
LFLLVALWAGLWVAALQAKQLALDGDHVYNAGLYGVLAGVIGARFWFVLSHWNNYAGDLTQALSLSRNALSPLAGLIIAGLVVLTYLQRHHVSLPPFLDAVAPGLAVAAVIGHIGAFLGGQELGAFSLMPWAIETAGTPRHPFHLYAAGAALLSFLILFFSRTWLPWPGFHLWLFVSLYSLAYLLLEVFRAQPPVISGGYLMGQITALAALVVTLAVMAYNFTRNEQEDSRF